MKTLLPWVEVNVNTNTHANNCLEGLSVWAATSDRAIVTSTAKNYKAVFDRILPTKPSDLDILPGLKTQDELTEDFASAAGWQRIVAAALELMSLTDQNICVFDNESSLDQYHRGNKPIDYAKLAVALSPLHHLGAEVWWNFPNLRAGDSGWRAREHETYRLVRTILESVPHSKFIVYYADEPEWQTPLAWRLRRTMSDMVGSGNMIELLHIQTGKWSWAEALEIMPVLSETVVVYPGWREWVQCATERRNLATRKAYSIM